VQNSEENRINQEPLSDTNEQKFSEHPINTNDATKAMKLLLEERQKFILIGLTGKTGSGCTTFANLMKSEDFKKLNPPLPKQFDFADSEERKYEIVYKYLETNWKKFDVIKVSDIITTFILDYTFDEFVEKLLELKIKRKIKGEYTYLNIFGDSLKENVKSELRKLKLRNNESEREILTDISKSLYDSTRESRNKVKHFYTHKNDGQEPSPKDTSEAYQFYFNKLPKFSKVLRDYLDRVEPKLSSQVFQAIGNNIRTSGSAFENNFTPSNIFELSQRINNLIKLVRDHDKNNRDNKESYIVIDAFRNPYEAVFFKDRYSAFHLISINTLEKERRARLNIQKELTETDINIIDEVESGSQIENNTTDKFTNQNIPECLQMADIHFINPEREKHHLHTLKMQLIKYISLIMHPGLITPTNIERCMQIAISAKLNSGCLSRQVGAVVTDNNYSIKSIGWNDVPKGQVSCNLRSLSKLINHHDSSAYSEYENNDNLFRKYFISKADEQLNNAKVSDRVFTYCFKDMYNGFKEDKNQVHTRSLHAEENAFLQLSKSGGPGIENGYLFTTASPCELCSKKAYQLGIKKIFYIDEYPGIAQRHILNNGTNKPELILFNGAIGTSYHKIYTPLMPLKDELYTLFDISFKW
jgi:deoxycytidylate deaminase